MIRWSRMKPLVQRLGVLRLKRLSKHVLNRSEPFADEELLTPGEFLLLAAAVVLTARQVVKDEQQDLVWDELGGLVMSFASQLSEKVGKEDRLPVAQLSFFDRQTARLSGMGVFLDLRSGKLIEKLPAAPVEVTSFDLTAIYLHTLRSLDHPAPAPRGQE